MNKNSHHTLAINVVFLSSAIMLNNLTDSHSVFYVDKIENNDNLRSQALIVAENDTDNTPIHRPHRNRNVEGDSDSKRNKQDDYEPQCDTPNWAMCTRRKKKHDDD